MAGPNHVPTDRMRAIDKLRRHQRILRESSTRLLKAANDLLEAVSATPHDLQEAIDLLESKDTALYEVEEKIVELLDDDTVERYHLDALAYRETIYRAINRLRSALNSRKASGITATTSGAAGTPICPRPFTSVLNGVRREHRDLSEMERPHTGSSTSVTPGKRTENAHRVVHMTTYRTSTRDSVTPAGLSEYNCCMTALQEPVPYDADKGCVPQIGCLAQNEQDQEIKNNLYDNVPQVLVQEQVIVAMHDSRFQHAKDDPQRKDMQVGASTELASSVPEKTKRDEREATRAADTEDLVDPVQADDKTLEFKDVNKRIQPPRFDFELEYVFAPDFIKSESLPDLRKDRLAPISALREVSPEHRYECFRIPGDRKSVPLVFTSLNCEETQRTGREPYSEPTTSTRTRSSREESTERFIRRSYKTFLRTRLGCLRTSHRTTKALTIARQRLSGNGYKIVEYQAIQKAGYRVLLTPTSLWRRQAVLKAARRRMHRWRHKTTASPDSSFRIDLMDRKPTFKDCGLIHPSSDFFAGGREMRPALEKDA